jgi:hypothetical protein
MTNSSATHAPSDHLLRDVAKVRQCLKCKTTFLNNWSGERICACCKKLNVWRNGAPSRPHPVGRRR